MSGPGHFTGKQYYASPNAEWVRTYPVYFPGREPAGYQEMLRAKKPEPLITSGSRTMPEWIAAGKRIFDEMDVPAFRSYDPKLLEVVRSREAFEKRGGPALKDGTVFKGYKVTHRAVAGHEFGLKAHRQTKPRSLRF